MDPARAKKLKEIEEEARVRARAEEDERRKIREEERAKLIEELKGKVGRGIEKPLSAIGRLIMGKDERDRPLSLPRRRPR